MKKLTLEMPRIEKGRLYGIAVDVGRNIHQLALLVRHVLAHAEARLPHRSRVDATAIIGHGRVLLERLHEGAHIVHAAEEPLAGPLPAGLVVQPGIHHPFLSDLGKSIARIKRGDTVEQFLIAQLRRLGQMDEQVEVVAHEAIRQNLDAGKLRHAPQPLDEARTLLVSQVERAVRDPTDQVITTIRLEIAQSSHAAHYSIFRNYSTTPTPQLGSDPHPLLQALHLELATGNPCDKTQQTPLSEQLPTVPDQSANATRRI